MRDAFRAALLAREPKRIHGTFAAAVLLLVALLAWTALTRVDLVVRAPGRVRPASGTERRLSDVSGEAIQCGARGRVVEVAVREGARVAAGDLLVSIDGARLDNELARARRALEAVEEESAKAALLEDLLEKEEAAGLARGRLELDRATRELARRRERRDSEIRLAELGVARAEDEAARLREVESRAIRQAEVEVESAERELAYWSEQDATRLDLAESALAQARVEEARLAQLLEAGAVPRADLERAALETRRSASALDPARESPDRVRARSRVAEVREELERIRVSLDRPRAEARVREAREELERAKLPLDEDEVALQAGSLDLIRAEVARRREELAAQRARRSGEVEVARAALANLELERAQCTVRSPAAGIVTLVAVRAGDLVEPGRTVVAVAPEDGLRLDVAVPADEAAHLAVGMPVRIRVDAYDHQRYGTLDGEVTFVSPDAWSDEDGAPCYLVRVRLLGTRVGRGEVRGELSLGMTCQAEIVTGHQSVLQAFVKGFRRSMSLG